jgi:hypothetical protein
MWTLDEVIQALAFIDARSAIHEAERQRQEAAAKRRR